MRKIYILLFGMVLLAGIGFAMYKSHGFITREHPYLWMDNSLRKNKSQRILAVYDPKNEIPAGPLQHYTLKIKADSNWNFEEGILEEIPDDRPTVLTVELYKEQVLQAVSEGVYDEKFLNLFQLLKSKQNLFLRLNPEMEIPSSDKPWANWGDFYVDAFQKFSLLADEHFPGSRVVWSPAGSIGNMEYFPGKDHYEVAGISLDAEDETDYFLKGKDLSKQLQRKLHRMRFVDSPILIFGSIEMMKEPVRFGHILDEFQRDSLFTNVADIRLDALPVRTDEPEIGLFDPGKVLLGNEAVQLEHLFTDFEQLADETFKEKISGTLSRNHGLIITFEPMKFRQDPSEPNILKRILSGQFDEEFRKFFALLPEDRKVYLRFMHEMEVPVHRYPWQYQDPILYIKAFRYFMTFPGSETKNIEKVWAPAGDRGSVDWWPGSELVDYISISVYGLPDKNITDFNKQDSFKEIYLRKRRRLDLFGKPFLIAEFGVKGDQEYQRRWMLEAAEVINKNKEIFGVSYFNREDVPKAWGEIQPPDWSISSGVFADFTGAIKDQK